MKLLRYFLVATGVLLLFGFVGWYYLSTTQLKVEYKNAHNVTVVDKQTNKQIGIINRPGDSVRVSISTSYVVRYSGNPGFANGSISVVSSDKPVLINPYFSDNRLDELLNIELQRIQNVIKKTYPTVDDLYVISDGKLFHFGDWYGTTLVYRGEYSQNSDTLRIILHKKGGVWVIATQPDILLTTTAYPSVPFDILSRTNTL